jgi:hypothetical protein
MKSIDIAHESWNTIKLRERRSPQANQRVINREIEIRGLNAIHMAWNPQRLNDSIYFTVAVEDTTSVFMPSAQAAFDHVKKRIESFGGTVSPKYIRIGKSLPMRLAFRAIVTNVMSMNIRKVRQRLGVLRTAREHYETAPKRRSRPPEA